MGRFTKILFASTFVPLYLSFTGCGSSGEGRGNTDEKEPGLTDVISGVGKLNDAAKRTGDLEALQNRLRDLEPLPREDLRASFPETLLGIPRTKIALGEAQIMAVNSGSAEYTDEGTNRKVSLSITDGAGETGSALLMTNLFALNLDMEEETTDGFKHTGEIGGHRASFRQRKDYDGDPRAEITFSVNNRYLVKLEGTKLDVETLKKAFNELNLSRLK